MYTCGRGRIFPHQVLAILQHLSLSESDASIESQRNKDVVAARHMVRHVKADIPITLIRNTDAT